VLLPSQKMLISYKIVVEHISPDGVKISPLRFYLGLNGF
jgi:hypothetical protein